MSRQRYSMSALMLRNFVKQKPPEKYSRPSQGKNSVRKKKRSLKPRRNAFIGGLEHVLEPGRSDEDFQHRYSRACSEAYVLSYLSTKGLTRNFVDHFYREKYLAVDAPRGTACARKVDLASEFECQSAVGIGRCS